MSAKVIFGAIAAALFCLAAVSTGTATAQSPPGAGPTNTRQVDTYDLPLAVLNDAYESETLTDPLSELLTDLFIVYLIAPVAGETPAEIETRDLSF